MISLHRFKDKLGEFRTAQHDAAMRANLLAWQEKKWQMERADADRRIARELARLDEVRTVERDDVLKRAAAARSALERARIALAVVTSHRVVELPCTNRKATWQERFLHWLYD